MPTLLFSPIVAVFDETAQRGIAMTEAQRPLQPRPAYHLLIESHRIEGTRVHDRDGKHVGTIDHLIIEKVRGRVVYVVASFGGLMGFGERLHTIPWEKLAYDTLFQAYRLEVTEAELQDAPPLPHDWDREQENAFRDYWGVGRYGW